MTPPRYDEDPGLGTGLLAALIFLLYLASVALAYWPAFRSDALRSAVTVTEISPAGGPAPFRIHPALPGPRGNVTEMAATVAVTPRLAFGGPGRADYEKGKTYILWVTADSFKNDTFGRQWVEPVDLQTVVSPLTLKQQRALLAPVNAWALLMAWPAAVLAGLVALWKWRVWSWRALVLLAAAWALVGGGVYGGGYLAALGV